MLYARSIFNQNHAYNFRPNNQSEQKKILLYSVFLEKTDNAVNCQIVKSVEEITKHRK